jgi:hypothetical protein
MSLVADDDVCLPLGFRVGQRIKTPAGRRGRVIGAHCPSPDSPNDPQNRLWVEYDDELQERLEEIDQTLKQRRKDVRTHTTHRTKETNPSYKTHRSSSLSAGRQPKSDGSLLRPATAHTVLLRKFAHQEFATCAPSCHGFLLPAREVTRVSGNVTTVYTSKPYTQRANTEWPESPRGPVVENYTDRWKIPALKYHIKDLKDPHEIGDVVRGPLGMPARVSARGTTNTRGITEQVLFLDYTKGGDGPPRTQPHLGDGRR